MNSLYLTWQWGPVWETENILRGTLFQSLLLQRQLWIKTHMIMICSEYRQFQQYFNFSPWSINTRFQVNSARRKGSKPNISETKETTTASSAMCSWATTFWMCGRTKTTTVLIMSNSDISNCHELWPAFNPAGLLTCCNHPVTLTADIARDR